MLALVLGLAVVAVLVWPPGATRTAGAVSVGVQPSSPGEAAESAGSEPVTVDEAADALVLCALAMRAGLAPTESLEAVAREVGPEVAHRLRIVASAGRWGHDVARAWAHVESSWRPAALAWRAAETSGAAPAGVVLAAAERMRREEASRAEAAVQRAGVLLVLPLGACFLPGFVGTTVVPIVLHLARGALGTID